MFRDQDLFPVGKLFKPHGYKGELKVDLDFESEVFIDNRLPVFIKIDNIPVPFFVEMLRGGNSRSAFIKLKGINSEEEAETLAKHELFALKGDLARVLNLSEEELEEEFEGLIGYSVYDASSNELIGKVIGVEEGVEYDYLVIKKHDGDESIDIPAIDEFISEINKTDGKGEIKVSLPEGFTDLYFSKP